MNPADPLHMKAYEPEVDAPPPYDEANSGQGAITLAVAVCVFIVFVATVWHVYQQNGSSTSPFLETVTSVPTAERRLPDEKDRVGYVAVGQDNPTLALSQPTIPDQPGIDLQTATANQKAKAKAADAADASSGSAPPVVIENVAPETSLDPLLATPPISVPPISVPTATEAAPPVLEPAPEPVTGPRLLAGGAFLVQIAAVEQAERIESAWAQASAKAPDLFRDAKRNIQTADVPNSGTFHRIRVDGFATKEDADGFCSALKQKGQTCFVVKR